VAAVNRVPNAYNMPVGSLASSHQQQTQMSMQPPQRQQSSFQISSLFPNLAESSFLQSFMLSQQPLETQQRTLQQMQANATAPYLFKGWSSPLPPQAATSAATVQGPSVKAVTTAAPVLPNSESSLLSPSDSSHAHASSLPAAPGTSTESSTPATSDALESSIMIPCTPSQIPMSPLDYIPAASRAGCLSNLPPPSNRSITIISIPLFAIESSLTAIPYTTAATFPPY
jgi:hypothetical protein